MKRPHGMEKGHTAWEIFRYNLEQMNFEVKL